jgi:biotin transporter BioY
MREHKENTENIEISDNNPQEDFRPKSIRYKIKQKIKQRLSKVKTKGKVRGKKVKKGLHIGIGSTALIVFCTFLIIVATFLRLNITHMIIPLKLFSGNACTLDDFMFTIKYIPQIPIIMFIVGLLGRRFGSISIILYLITGLFFLPVFALGGGIHYVTEYSFGYLAAFVPAGIILGTILKNGYTYKNIAKAVFWSVITIHIIGILYMTGLAILKHAGINFVLNWINAQSGIKIIYDLIFSFMAVFVTKYLRVMLWFYM